MVILKKLKKMSLMEIVQKLVLYTKDFISSMIPIWPGNNVFVGFSSKADLFVDARKKEFYIKEMIRLGVKDEILLDGERIYNHVFKLLGFGNIQLEQQLQWNTDFVSGFSWTNKYHKRITVIDLGNAADVKVPWELSRFQHLFTLGKAYWLSKDEKFAMEFMNQILTWMNRNPVGKSVNWTCSMEVAIRAVNLIVAHTFFKDSSSIDAKFWTSFNRLLYLHGRYIKNNLEKHHGVTGNHYLTDIVGLTWIGIYFKESLIESKTNKWLKYGIKELNKEMQVQVNQDGTNYEASTAYHRLVTEMLLITTMLCRNNSIVFPKEYMKKLYKMCEFIAYITKPNGLAPLIGDNDDGRFFIVSKYSSRVCSDFTYLLVVAGEFFHNHIFSEAGSMHLEDTLWLAGCNRYKNQMKGSYPSYRDGGYFVLRDHQFYCLIRCGALGLRGIGGHSHNDQLSIELNVCGQDFFIDPGVYSYTGNYRLRNLFRSTAYHNTVIVNNLEQNSFSEFELFEMREQSRGTVIKFSRDAFYGKHYGFQDKCGVMHYRKISLENNELKIIDKIKPYTKLELYASFILAEGVKVERTENGVSLKKNGICVFMVMTECNSIEIAQALISHSYGQLVETKQIRVAFSHQLTCSVYIAREDERKND